MKKTRINFSKSCDGELRISLSWPYLSDVQLASLRLHFIGKVGLSVGALPKLDSLFLIAFLCFWDIIWSCLPKFFLGVYSQGCSGLRTGSNFLPHDGLPSQLGWRTPPAQARAYGSPSLLGEPVIGYYILQELFKCRTDTFYPSWSW